MGWLCAEMAALKMGRGTTQLREHLDACLLTSKDEPAGMAKSSAGLQVCRVPLRCV